MAHKTTQKLNTETVYWFHAYLHRVKGDISNTEFWYGRANIEPNSIPLEKELNDIINSVFI